MTGPAPVVAAQRVAVRRALADLPTGSRVLVACSGGADSLALAAATAFVAPRMGLRAGAVVVDHGVQPGSPDVAARAADQCRVLGLDPAEVVRVTVEVRGEGPEAAARAARYAALEHAAARLAASVVLLGHTLDDQAESVLLGLARGSGPRSLAGMTAVRGVLCRPFLGVRRSETLEACEALGLDPWHDPTNLDGPGAPLRSQVRHRLMPVLEEVLGPVAPALARTAEQLREEDELLEGLAAELLGRARLAPGPARPPHDEGEAGSVGSVVVGPSHDGEPARLDLDLAVLGEAPAALRRRALHRAVLAVGGRGGSLRRSHVLAVEALVVDWHGQGPVALPGGGEARRACGRLTLCEAAAAARGPTDGAGRDARTADPTTHREQ